MRLARLNPQPFREVKRRLEAAGFVEVSQKGSHVKFARRVGETIDTAIVPRKSEIPVGTLRSILSQAHIEPDDWNELG
ncbi:MAG: type II toxin-antitoxin system HicA family toxin [Terriglobales bacterium]